MKLGQQALQVSDKDSGRALQLLEAMDGQLPVKKVVTLAGKEKAALTDRQIDQLRTGMDEIRAILRKGRPPKYKLAVLQLQKLCEECRVKGIDASLVIEGELEQIPPKLLEIMLDNAYEAVSNSMKYAKCTKIEMKIIVMNQIVRCAISDNGIGCSEITDGMGLAGMRRRIREVNGVIDFVSEAGFTINMLMPI